MRLSGSVACLIIPSPLLNAVLMSLQRGRSQKRGGARRGQTPKSLTSKGENDNSLSLMEEIH